MNPHINDHGRGTVQRPANRFEKLAVEIDAGAMEEIAATDPDFVAERPVTKYLRDDSQSIICKNASPDLGFDASLNPYRGCEHGCAYCYARPYHEYLGFDSGLDFETRIMVKPNAPDLLEAELSAPRWRPQNLACSGVTDCYQPVERSQKITRACLEVLTRFRNPVGIVTKNALVTRDIDHLQHLARFQASAVMLSITSLDSELARKLEPRASSPAARLRAIRELSDAGIPAGVSMAPIIPGLNEHEIPAILQAAADHGATFAAYTVVRLPYAVKDVFSAWLQRHSPDRRDLVLGRIRELRNSELNDADFGTRMRGTGPLADQIRTMFQVALRRTGLNRRGHGLSTEHFCRVQRGQMELFD